MKKHIVILCLLITTATLGACGNTLDGIGRDIERMGERMQGE